MLVATSNRESANFSGDFFSRNNCINNLIRSANFDDSGNLIAYNLGANKPAFEFDHDFYNAESRIKVNEQTEGTDLNLYKEI